MNRYEGPLFIIGMPRSGTKLIRQLLNQHPLIRIPSDETEFFPWLDRYANQSTGLSELPNFLQLFKAVERFPFFLDQREKGSPVSPTAWYASCATFNAAGIFEGLIRYLEDAKPGSGVIWGDKSPSYITAMPLLKRSFPDGRFIHIIRDVRDYCLSMNKAWGKDMPRAAQRWADAVSAARKSGTAFGECYCEIRYEDLLQDPEGRLRDICRFLGVDFLDSVLNVPHSAEDLGDTRNEARIVQENVRKYVQDISGGKLQRIERIAGAVMLDCGYELVLSGENFRRLSSAEMAIGRMKDTLNLIRNNSSRVGVASAVSRSWGYFWATRK